MDDETNDGTIGIPRRLLKFSEQVVKRLERPNDALSQQLDPDERLSPRNSRDTGDIKAANSSPRSQRSGGRLPDSSSPPDTIVEQSRSSGPPPKPREVIWSDFDSVVSSVPLDPNWSTSPTEPEVAKVDARRLEPLPPGKADPLAASAPGLADDPRPGQDRESVPRTLDLEAIPPRPEPPRPGSSKPNPRTPSSFSRPVQPPKPARASRPASPPRDDLRTMQIGDGLGLGVSNSRLMIQFFDGGGHWRELEPLTQEEQTVGRASFRRGTSATEFLAVEHLRLISEGDQLFVEEGETLNGVYLKVPTGRPIELTHGTRFQVGQHSIEFLIPDRSKGGQPLVSPGGEVYRWRALEPLAYLDFVGPADGSTIRFPLTKLDGTVIGREGDISLTGDTWSSRSHAKVSCQGDRFFLEDLGSTNGTFVKINGRTPLKTGNTQSSSSGDVLLIGAVLIRVVETD